MKTPLIINFFLLKSKMICKNKNLIKKSLSLVFAFFLFGSALNASSQMRGGFEANLNPLDQYEHINRMINSIQAIDSLLKANYSSIQASKDFMMSLENDYRNNNNNKIDKLINGWSSSSNIAQRGLDNFTKYISEACNILTELSACNKANSPNDLRRSLASIIEQAKICQADAKSAISLVFEMETKAKLAISSIVNEQPLDESIQKSSIPLNQKPTEYYFIGRYPQGIDTDPSINVHQICNQDAATQTEEEFIPNEIKINQYGWFFSCFYRGS